MSVPSSSLPSTQPPQKTPHICVCICTYKRPDLLRRLLEKLNHQETHGAFTYSAVVADNDAACSAAQLAATVAQRSHISIIYCSEPRQNISLVRNKALEHAQGDFIAFIDDDEFPADDWLARLLETCDSYSAAGALGPVRPHFDQTPPTWLVKGRFCERPEHETGTVMQWSKCRTGNVLLRRSLLQGIDEPFRKEFGTGGEDQDFFRRMGEKGCKFVWCNEAVAYETVPPSRWTRSYLCKRALLRGRNGLKHPSRTRLIVESLLALPVYSVLVPITVLFGQHVFVNYAVRFCDHLGRLLTVLHLNPVDER